MSLHVQACIYFFSIISFATVGFGDKFPTADDPIRLIAMICYLVWGMILMTTTFSIVSSYLRTVGFFFFSRNFISVGKNSNFLSEPFYEESSRLPFFMKISSFFVVFSPARNYLARFMS